MKGDGGMRDAYLWGLSNKILNAVRRAAGVPTIDAMRNRYMPVDQEVRTVLLKRIDAAVTYAEGLRQR